LSDQKTREKWEIPDITQVPSRVGGQAAVSFTSFGNVINGKLQNSAVQAKGLDPSTGTALWEVPVAGKEDLEEAISAANKAFPEWSKTPWKERQKLLAKLRATLLVLQEEMAELLMKEVGKPVNISQARTCEHIT
jgi:acyl-CoA reductase-like NAD-dependent aldehyde dehydrogenase